MKERGTPPVTANSHCPQRLVYRTRAVAAGQVSAVSSLMIAWRRQLAPRLGGHPTRTLGDDMLKFARWSRKLTAVSQSSSAKGVAWEICGKLVKSGRPREASFWPKNNLRLNQSKFMVESMLCFSCCVLAHNWLSNNFKSPPPPSQCLLVLEILATHLMFFTVLFLTIKAWLLTTIIVLYGNLCKCRWANAVSGIRYEYSKCFIRLYFLIIHYHNICGAPGHRAPIRSITRKKSYHRRCHWNIIRWCRTCKWMYGHVSVNLEEW